MENGIKAILFDMDGVLVDACEWHYEALNKALTKNGLNPIERTDHLSVYNGLPTKKKLHMMGLSGEMIDKVSADKKQFTAQIVKERCKPDIQKHLILYALDGYKLACCSNAIKESVVDMLTKAKINEYFDLILGNDEIENPKPNPEIYLKAFKELGVEPEECLIIEDAPHGIEAAKASGATCIAVRGYEDVNIDLFRRLGCL